MEVKSRGSGSSIISRGRNRVPSIAQRNATNLSIQGLNKHGRAVESMVVASNHALNSSREKR